MKKVNFKNGLFALLAVLALMLIDVQKVEAQAINEMSTGLYDAAPGNFVSPTEAEDILLGNIETLAQSLQALPQGPAYTAAVRAAVYYRGIYQELQVGKSVSESIGSGLGYLNDSVGLGDLSRYDLADLRQSAIELLQ